MRFASHRDVARAIERGVRKAHIPVAYSAGFSPHPRISYSGGAPTGAASEAEYLELSLSQCCEPADVGRQLDAALPDGIDVVEVVEANVRSVALQLEASDWEVIWPGVAADDALLAVQAFLSAPSVEVERLTSKGMRRLDARAAVVSLTVERRAETDSAAGCAILRMIVRQLTPAVRPEDILAALTQTAALAPASPPMVTRLWQGPLSDLISTAGQAARPRPSDRLSDRPGHDIDKAMRLTAESAEAAPAWQVRANEQLPRGAQGRIDGPRAREPYGRDCPDARDRAAESTVRSQ